jgi:hypothetical protein
MQSRIYSFERNGAGSSSSDDHSPSHDAIRAVIAAADGHSGIGYEELTDSDNSNPMIAVLFVDDVDVTAFGERLEVAVDARRLRIRNIGVE